jgi:murein DD-endopeptidase MepM/ murein hydrolase activator NlpD
VRRLLLAFALAAALTTSAQAATFTQVPTQLPSHETPNAPGSITVPLALSTPPAVPEQRSYQQLLTLWQSAGAAYGIPWEVLAAINKIESNFGRNMGPSSAGAVGWMQFMPSTWARWGMDANGDGVANPWNPEDAIYAAARYLAAANGQEDLSRAIFAYNHAQWYVDDVLELARLFGEGGVAFDFPVGDGSFAGASPIFQLDEIQQRLEEARADVSRAQEAIAEAEKEVERAGWATLEAEQRAGDPELTDAEFRRLEAEVTKLVLAEDKAAAELERRRTELAEAVERLNALRDEASAQASAIDSSRPLTNAFGAPQSAGGYVFPVGGGPEVVSVAHSHHDYPAADIAAPEGAPLYALADSLVIKTWPEPTDRCGLGLELQLANGEIWLYCHLSYLEPDVVPGRVLRAGTPVGLNGATGNATGPHLHLQLVPSERYPQEEAWFQSFAGVAFSWQDAPTPTRSHSSGKVFDVVDDSSGPVFQVISD